MVVTEHDEDSFLRQDLSEHRRTDDLVLINSPSQFTTSIRRSAFSRIVGARATASFAAAGHSSSTS
jgi:hypothetical protein